MSTRQYEIRVVGSIGPAAREAFSDMGVDVEPASTVLSGPLDQGALHVMLDRVRALGLELVDVRPVPGTAELDAQGAGSPPPGEHSGRASWSSGECGTCGI